MVALQGGGNFLGCAELLGGTVSPGSYKWNRSACCVTIVDARSTVSRDAAGAVGAAALALLRCLGRAWPVGRIALERQRRFGIDIQDRHRDISGVRRRDVVGRRRLSRRSIADQMGGRSHPRVFFRDTAMALPGPSPRFERERLELSYRLSRQWHRAAVGARHRRPLVPSILRISYVDSCSARHCRTAGIRDCLVTRCRQSNSRRAERRKFNQSRAEVLRLWTAVFRAIKASAPPTKPMWRKSCCSHRHEPGRCRKRVNDVIVEAKTAADTARKGRQCFPSG